MRATGTKRAVTISPLPSRTTRISYPKAFELRATSSTSSGCGSAGSVALIVGAVASLAIGFTQPEAWLLALLLYGVHMVIWVYTFAVRAGRNTSVGREAKRV